MQNQKTSQQKNIPQQTQNTTSFLNNLPETIENKILLNEDCNSSILSSQKQNEFLKFIKSPKNKHEMTSFSRNLQYSRKKSNYKKSLESIPSVKKIGAFAKPFCKDMFQEYSSQSDNEQIIYYNQGGYKLVYIGQVLSNRYIVLEKLGWGEHSTVWLCKDQKRNTYVALKIFKSALPYLEVGFEETEILQRINRVSLDKHWLKVVKKLKKQKKVSKNDCHVVTMLNAFIDQNIIKQNKNLKQNRQNMCLSFEVLGESLYTLLAKNNWKGLPINIIRNLIKQILIALHFLHEHCNIIHCDLRPQNILFQLTSKQLKSIKENQTLKNFSKQKKRLNRQKIQVKAIQLDHNWKNKSDSSVDITYSKRGRIDQCFNLDQGDNLQKKLLLTQEDFQQEYERQVLLKQISDQKKKKALKKKLKKKMKKHIQQYKKEENQNFNSVDIDNKTLDILHKRSVIKHGNFKFDIKKDFSQYEQIKLIDFSRSCWVNNKQVKKIQKRQYRAPEVLLEKHFNSKIDIWSLGCILFEMITGEYLFNPQKDIKQKKSKTENHIELIQEFIGIFPNHMDPQEIITRKNEQNKRKKIEYNQQFTRPQQKNKLSLEYLLVKLFQWQPLEAKKLNNFLMKFLRIDPHKRSSAIELLQDPWLYETNEDIFGDKDQLNEHLKVVEQQQFHQQLCNQFQEEDFYADESDIDKQTDESDREQYSDEYDEQIKIIDSSFRQVYNPQIDLQDFQQQDNTANWFFDQKLFKQLQWIIYRYKFFN